MAVKSHAKILMQWSKIKHKLCCYLRLRIRWTLRSVPRKASRMVRTPPWSLCSIMGLILMMYSTSNRSWIGCKRITMHNLSLQQLVLIKKLSWGHSTHVIILAHARKLMAAPVPMLQMSGTISSVSLTVAANFTAWELSQDASASPRTIVWIRRNAYVQNIIVNVTLTSAKGASPISTTNVWRVSPKRCARTYARTFSWPWVSATGSFSLLNQACATKLWDSSLERESKRTNS